MFCRSFGTSIYFLGWCFLDRLLLIKTFKRLCRLFSGCRLRFFLLDWIIFILNCWLFFLNLKFCPTCSGFRGSWLSTGFNLLRLSFGNAWTANSFWRLRNQLLYSLFGDGGHNFCSCLFLCGFYLRLLAGCTLWTTLPGTFWLVLDNFSCNLRNWLVQQKSSFSFTLSLTLLILHLFLFFYLTFFLLYVLESLISSFVVILNQLFNDLSWLVWVFKANNFGNSHHFGQLLV